MTISSGPKRLSKTQVFENKGYLSTEENILAYFFLIIECDKPQAPPKGNLTIIVQMIRSSLCDLSGRRKQTFQKKTIFPVTNNFGPFFLVLPSMADLRHHFLRLHEVFWQSVCKVKDHFCNTKRLLITQLFEKQVIFTVKKNILAHFFSYHRVWQTSGKKL